MYDGGKNVVKQLDAATTARVRALFEQAFDRVADRVATRNMGVGILRKENGNGEGRLSYFVSFKSAESSAFRSALADLKA
jgi:hypothetical protein